MNKVSAFLLGLAIIVSCHGTYQKRGSVSESVDLSTLIEKSQEEEFSFMKNLCTGDSLLDYAIKEYIAYGCLGLYSAELSKTYPPAKVLRYGNKEMKMKQGETECEFFKDSVAYLEHSYKKYKQKPAYVKRSLYLPYISRELFKANGKDVEFRGYAVAVLIKPENKDGYYIDTEDIVCVNKNNQWFFYPCDFSSHEEYLVDRIQVLLSFMKEEGFPSSEVESISNYLQSYKVENDAIMRVSPDNLELAALVNDWYKGSRVIMGEDSGDPLDYLYKKGYENLMGVSLSDSDLREFIKESMQELTKDQELDLYLIPYSIRYVKTTNSGIEVYLLKSVMGTKDRFTQLVKGRNILLKIPGETNCKIVELSEETVKSASVILTGILSKEEVRSLLYEDI